MEVGVEENRKFLHDPVDEVLEALWILRERGLKTGAEDIIKVDEKNSLTTENIDDVVRKGYLALSGGVYDFTEKGRERGGEVIRRHRLAERLLTDVLNMEDNEMESDACRFEHFLSPEVTNHICTLLGHPKTCPHGNSIPRGKCCENAEKRYESAVVPLGLLKCGETGRVLYMTTPRHDRLDRLTSLGLFPGRHVKIHQREPLFVVFIGETQLALEKSIVDDIYGVRT